MLEGGLCQVTPVTRMSLLTTRAIANEINSHYYPFAFALNTFQEVENGQGLSCGDGEAWLVFDANASSLVRSLPGAQKPGPADQAVSVP